MSEFTSRRTVEMYWVYAGTSVTKQQRHEVTPAADQFQQGSDKCIDTQRGPETQLSLTNRAMRLEVSQGHKHGTIRYVGYGFLLVFYSNFVPKMHQFGDIWLLTIQWSWNQG